MADATAKAEETAALLNKTVLTIAHQAGEDGRLFGSVTSQDIADAIKEARGVSIDRRNIHLDEPIKTVGTRMVVVEVETGVTATVKTMVVEQKASRVRTAREASLTAASSGRRCFRPTLRVEHVFDSRPIPRLGFPLSAPERIADHTATATIRPRGCPTGRSRRRRTSRRSSPSSAPSCCPTRRCPRSSSTSGLHPDDFYREAHGLVFQAMLELHNGGEPVDALTLVEHLKQAGQLDAVGGRATIDLLAASVPAVGHLRQYARIVRENAMLRRLLRAAYEIQARVHAHDAPPRELVDIAERTILEVAHEDSRKDFRAINDVLDVEISKLEELSREGKDVTGTPSGFADLDTYTGGFQPGNLIILAARPRWASRR